MGKVDSLETHPELLILFDNWFEERLNTTFQYLNNTTITKENIINANNAIKNNIDVNNIKCKLENKIN